MPAGTRGYLRCPGRRRCSISALTARPPALPPRPAPQVQPPAGALPPPSRERAPRPAPLPPRGSAPQPISSPGAALTGRETRRGRKLAR